MKILLLTLAPVLSREAPAVQVANMAQAFADLGHDVTVVATVADPTIDADQPERLLGFRPSFRIMTLSRRIHRGQSYLHALRIARLARRGGFDLVFSRNLRGALLPALRGVPTVFEAHTLSSLTGAQDRRILARLLRTPGFRGIVAISQGLADDLVAEFRLDPDRVLVAHDAVRIEGEVPPPAPRDRDDRLRVGYTGSLFSGRGVEVLLETARRTSWIELHLVGGPADAAQRIAEEVARTADDPHGSNVMVHGQVSPIESRASQRSMDVLVAPFARRVETDSGVDTSRWMSPMKVFEYMASGRPIVISDLPVLREVLRPDVDALMVEPEDPDALIAALEQLRDDPDLGARLAASALERVRSEFTWELRARRILARFMPDATGAPGRP
jgi:glycosyltransferase involved in cell wall biosynthesis